MRSLCVPCAFPRKKWVPFINMHKGRVNDVIYCDNLGKNGFLHTNEVPSQCLCCILIRYRFTNNLGKNGFLHTNEVPSQCVCCILIRYRFTNERHSTTIETIGLFRLARALLTLIGSCRIYSIFQIKARSPFSILLLSQTPSK